MESTFEEGFLKGDNTYALFLPIYGYVPIEYNAISVWIQLNLVLWAAILFLRFHGKKRPQIALDTSLFLGYRLYYRGVILVLFVLI